MVGSSCPYCRCSFADGDDIVTCVGCATKHHADCLQENGGCTVFGCSQAPPEEAKINVSSLDVSAGNQTDVASSMPPSQLLAGSSTPPPPPLPGIVPPPPPLLQEIPHLTFAGYAPSLISLPGPYPARKSRVVFVLLAVLLGAFGGHNFYAGYVKKAVIQLCLTLLSCFVGGLVSWVWAIVEACTIERDHNGIAFV